MRPQAKPRTNELIKFLRDIEMKIFSDPSTIATPHGSNVHTRSARAEGPRNGHLGGALPRVAGGDLSFLTSLPRNQN